MNDREACAVLPKLGPALDRFRREQLRYLAEDLAEPHSEAYRAHLEKKFRRLSDRPTHEWRGDYLSMRISQITLRPTFEIRAAIRARGSSNVYVVLGGSAGMDGRSR